jgi:membrane-bound lytic murein transglycosylase D
MVFNVVSTFNIINIPNLQIMKRILSYIITLIYILPTISAQETDTLSLKEEWGEMPESITMHVDSMLKQWHAKHLLSFPTDIEPMEEVAPVSDSVYADRLMRIPSLMELPYNDVVRKYIDQYLVKQRGTVAYLLGAMNFYMPIFEEALDVYDLPNELKFLPIIESALNPQAQSRAGAVGLWQFMLKTGKLYGLKSNSLVDERRDPIKATFAAAQYLKELYEIYEDWSLVIAAYNCGPGNVNKAIHRAQGSHDYWEIYPYLPRETRGYVPHFIAANYVMNYYCHHNIIPMETQLPDATDTLHIGQDLHFQQVADLCNVSMEEVRALNPQYKKDIVPGASMQCILRLPMDAITKFIDYGDSIYEHNADKLFTKRRYVTAKDGTKRRVSIDGGTYHTIKRGETLSTIARKYGITVTALRELNGLKGNNITAGKKLRVSD